MIVPYSKRKGWFHLDMGTAEPLYALPGTQMIDGRFIAHRSHLPLLEDPDAATALAKSPGAVTSWDQRIARAAEQGWKPRTTQLQAADFMSARSAALLGDDMRTGKGHPIGTRLLGPYGWFPIEMSTIGSEIMGRDGQAHKITGVFRRGRLPTFRVTFSDETSIFVDEDHLWALWHHNDWHRGKNYRTLPTKSITKLRDAANNMQWRIPLVAPLAFRTPNLFDLDPYLLGVLLGDGSFTADTISFCCGDEQTPREVAKVLPSGIRLVRRASKDRAATWGLSREDASKPNPLTVTLTSLRLMGLGSPQKFIPDCFLFSSVEARVALLQGLLDTDGEYFDGCLSFCSSSERLRDSVRFIVQSLGGVATARTREFPKYTHKGEQRVGLPSYRTTLSLPAWVKPFRSRVGYQPRPKFQPVRLIKSIEPVDEQEIICISIDAPDQLYVTEHCIVTHNTCAALMCHDPARGPLVVIAPLNTRGVWLGWMRRLWPERFEADEVGIITGKTFDRETISKPIVFGHYDVIHKWMIVGKKIGTLIFDEAHAITNPDARRTKAAHCLRMNAELVLALTGTPIWKFAPNLWSILQVLYPGAWGSHKEFCMRYGDPEETGHGTKYRGASNQVELNARLSEVMLRRRWIDIADDLPPITRSVVVADLTTTERNKLDIIAAEIKLDRSNTVANLAAYRRQVATITMKETIKATLRVVGPVVVWAWHKDFATKIAKKLAGSDEIDAAKADSPLRPVFLVHGDVPVSRRDDLIQAWRNTTDGIMVATMSTFQAGIDLSHSKEHAPRTECVFGELDYVPGVIAQAEMRTYDATRPMNVTFVVANHFVHQRIVRALVAKLGAADSLGVGAAVDAIDALRDAVFGPEEVGDLDRLLEDFIASAA